MPQLSKSSSAIPAGKLAGNRFDRMEWAGAFGDLGTLIPFVAAYVSLLKVDPFGMILAFGIANICVGLFYKTPIPVQPMKAISAVATTQAAQTIVITEENNCLFLERKVSANKMAASAGIMNLLGSMIGAVPMCHGAGGMAGHVRFGARTGGASIILSTLTVAAFAMWNIGIAFLFGLGVHYLLRRNIVTL